MVIAIAFAAAQNTKNSLFKNDVMSSHGKSGKVLDIARVSIYLRPKFAGAYLYILDCSAYRKEQNRGLHECFSVSAFRL